MKTAMTLPWRLAAFIFLTLAMASCGRITEPRLSSTRGIARDRVAPSAAQASPESPPGQLSFPAAVGNRWRYRSEQVMQDVVGGVELTAQMTQDAREEFVGYFAETPYGTLFELQDGRTRYERAVHRQDRSGLYVRYFPVVPGAGSELALSSDPLESRGEEFVVLRYPLHVGDRWLGRDAEWVVEGVDLLDLPAGRTRAFRIRGTRGPTAWTLHWFGECGRVQTEQYTEAPLIESGQVVGTRKVRTVETLESLELTSCAKCGLCH